MSFASCLILILDNTRIKRKAVSWHEAWLGWNQRTPVSHRPWMLYLFSASRCDTNTSVFRPSPSARHTLWCDTLTAISPDLYKFKIAAMGCFPFPTSFARGSVTSRTSAVAVGLCIARPPTWNRVSQDLDCQVSGGVTSALWQWLFIDRSGSPFQ